jgi:phenylacetate-CoA ligase
MTVFEAKNEAMRQDLLEQVQLERMQALLARLRRNVRRYRELLGEAPVTSLADVRHLPFTTPEDLTDAFPYGMFALPLREVKRLHSTMGPAGRPLVLGYTANDLRYWGRLAARQLVSAGVTPNDVVQIGFDSGVFEQSFGYLTAAEQIGAPVVPQDPVHIEYQLEVLRNYRTTVLVTTPANALELVSLLAGRRIDPQSLHLRNVLLSRPIEARLRNEIGVGLFAGVRCTFGIPEIMDPGLCVECEYGHLHANEDHFYVEIDNGELVLTTLCREAMPLLRYRTRVACTATRKECACGRTGMVLAPGRRLDSRLLVNETPVYEAQIAQVLAKTRAAGQPFRLDITERGVSVDIAVSQQCFGDEMRVLANLRIDIEAEFMARLGIQAKVHFVSALA